MKTRKIKIKFAASLFVTVAIFGSSLQAAMLIYREDFSGGGANLNGSMPAVNPGGASWIAAGHFKQDGTVQAVGGGSATLAFTPQVGFIYTLDLTLAVTAPDGNWIGFGFAKGQNTLVGNAYRFTGQANNPPAGLVAGRAWSLVRGSSSVNANQSWLGSGNTGTATTNPFQEMNWPGSWSDGATFDLRIVLDTSPGSDPWTATWLAKLSSDESYTTVRPTAVILDKDITSVGFATSNSAVSGSLSHFSLTRAIPEPSVAFLSFLGMLILMSRRR